jgi:hypothetical protein
MFWKKKKHELDFKRRLGSLAFYFAIPTAFVLTILITSQLVAFLRVHSIDPGRPILFSHAALAGILLSATLLSQRMKTLIHELKHAALVILTGNILKEISVRSNGGHVTYQTYKSRLHLEPFVAMAPYFFPLFSLPVFIAALFLERLYPTALLYSLGFFYGIDLATGYMEISSHQSDLRRIYGGFLATRLFLLVVHLLYFASIAYWTLSGITGIVVVIDNLSTAAEVLSGDKK